MPRVPVLSPALPALLPALLLALLLAGCANDPTPSAGKRPAPEERPALGACRVLAPDDLEQATDTSATVPCREPHTAQTFLVGTLPGRTGTDRTDPRHGGFVHRRCGKAFGDFLGADESRALRTNLTWAWFRPSDEAWSRGARWFRCDAVGTAGATGGAPEGELPRLPTRLEGIFGRAGDSDRWQTCARGARLADAARVPCSEPHDWRAVTAVKVGTPDEAWPGEKIVRARSRDRCSDWVGAWLHYTPDYDFAYTWFHEAEWQTGNRRSVCWAKTDQ